MHRLQSFFVGRQTRFLLALIVVAAILPVSFATKSALADGTIEATANLSSNDTQSEAPQLSTGGNRLGAVWGERETNTLGSSTAVVDGAFDPETYLNTGTQTKQQWPDVVVDASGTMHMAYAAQSDIFYRKKPVGGTWSNAVRVAGDSFPNPIRIALAPNGTLWVVWRDTDGDKVRFRFSDNGGVGWSGGLAGGIVNDDAGNMAMPDIAIGSDNNPHVVWYILGGGGDVGEIKYADWDGSTFRSGKVTNDGTSFYDADPSITVDSNNVQHITWRKQLSSSGDSWGIMYARRVPGKGWSDFAQLAATNGDAKYAPNIGTDNAGSLYIGYSDPNSNTRQIAILGKPVGQANWTAQEISKGRWDYRPTVVGTTNTGVKAHVLYQAEAQPDQGEIIYVRLRFGGVLINAEPVVNNGATATNSTSATITFKNVSGDPKEVRWRWNAPPTDAVNDSNGWQPYANPLTAPLPSSIPVGTCTNLTFYAQVRNGGAVNTSVASAVILYDAAAQASAIAQNPNLSGGLQTWSNKGAYVGDPRFTRDNNYTLTVTDLGDCSKLSGYGLKSATNEAVTVFPDGASSQSKMQIFPETTAPGAVAGQTAFVIDKANNRSEFPLTMYYDPFDGGAIGTSSGAPQLATTTNPTVTVSTANTLLRRLTLSNISVNDQVYGSVTGLPAGKQFWGVWVAVSKTLYAADQINTVNNPLKWSAIQVPSPDATFTVDASLATGQDSVPLTSYAGTYYVYTKFLDGAGNPSTATLISGPVTLAAGYSVPTINAPLVAR